MNDSTSAIPTTPTPTSTVQWVGLGLDREVGFELQFDRPVAGRFPATEQRVLWVQGAHTLTAELSDLPEGTADPITCLRVLTAVGADLAGTGYGLAAQRRLPDQAGQRLLMWWTRPQGTGLDHTVMVGVCTGRRTLATLKLVWTSPTGTLDAEWPAVRQFLEQWKVTVR